MEASINEDPLRLWVATTFEVRVNVFIFVWSMFPKGGPQSVFKIEVSNALQTRYGPSKYTSLKTTLHNAIPNCKGRRHLKRRALSLQEVELDGCFLILHMVLKTCTI